jgi:heme exporter protein B
MRLEASGLACVRGGREVFTGLGFSVGTGEALLVTGRNGAGKSSLLRMVAGLVRVAGGRLALVDADPDQTIPEQAHYLGHQDALKPSLTVAENLSFWARYLGGAEPVQGALAAVGLAALANLPAAYLSAGQRRRLSIARLLAAKRPRGPGHARRADAATPVRRRDHRGGGAWADRARPRQGVAAGRLRMSPLAALFIRDIRLAIRVGGGGGIGVLFFLIVVVLMPFAIGPELTLLARLGPAILWLGALLASLLTLDRLFAVDHEDGSLDLILMSNTPLELAVAAKAAAHWLTTGLPLVIATPLLGLFMNLDAKASAAVMLTLLAGTPALTFIGLIGAALSVALRRGGLLLAVLVLPLTVPVWIFGVAASNAAIVGPLPFGTPFTILCALMLTSLVVGIFAAAAALRQGME